MDPAFVVHGEILYVAAGQHVQAGAGVSDPLQRRADAAEQFIAIDHETPPFVRTAGAPGAPAVQRRRAANPLTGR